MIIRVRVHKCTDNKISLYDWLLIVGLALAPMTGLRVWKIGPAEVLCLLWGIKYLFSSHLINNDISLFFALFITALVIGSLVGAWVAPDELRLSGLLTWLYLAIIAVTIYNGISQNPIEYNEKLFFVFAKVATIWYIILYFYGRFISRLFIGVRLFYGQRFCAGGTNPHQIAILMCALCFVYLRQVFNKKLFVGIAGFLICFYLLLQTQSSTAVLSVTIGLLCMLYFFLPECFPERRKLVFWGITFFIVLVVAIGYSFFYTTFMNWIAKDSNGLGRISIFSTFTDGFWKSPIFGLGPGVHGRDGLIEYHNTYLEILAATGLIGGFVFLFFTIRIVKKCLSADWKLLIIVIAMYAYGLAGFAMRRLVFWGVLAFVTVISEQIIEKQSRYVKEKG